MDNATTPSPNPLLRRRNSIATSVLIPTQLSLPDKLPHHHSIFTTTSATTTSSSSSSSSSSQSFVDFELISIRPISSYTSLKDLLPSTAVNSPTSSTSAISGGEISIRNRLVKQAAWAYLQPMSTSPDSASRSFLHRLWVRFDLLKNQVMVLLRSMFGVLTQAFDRLLRTICIRSSR